MKKMMKFVLLGMLIILFAGCSSSNDSGTSSQSSEKTITAFSLGSDVGTINEAENTIAVSMPFGTDVTAMVATFTTTGESV